MSLTRKSRGVEGITENVISVTMVTRNSIVAIVTRDIVANRGV